MAAAAYYAAASAAYSQPTDNNSTSQSAAYYQPAYTTPASTPFPGYWPTSNHQSEDQSETTTFQRQTPAKP